MELGPAMPSGAMPSQRNEGILAMDSDFEILADDANDPDPPITAAGGVVYRWAKSRQLEILLIKKQGGFWTLPKGRVKIGEDDHQAVVREVAEETNILG